jgi:acyl-CoA thioester hydrolase
MTISDSAAMASHTIRFRVEYHETDGQRRAHHANYPIWFERGRVEMLRSMDLPYKTLEDAGIHLVVTEMTMRYYDAAQFDDEIDLTTELIEVRKVRLTHRYRLRRGDQLLGEGQSVIACISHEGKPTRLPDNLMAILSSAR